MRYYVGLDVSNKETSICIINENDKVIKNFKVLTDPDTIAEALLRTGLNIVLIGLEAGSLSHWLMEGLLKKNLPVKCIDSRRMAAIIQTNVNKTDKNDAREIARAMKNSNYREVFQKSHKSREIDILMSSRKTMVNQLTDLKNTVRGHLKTYGIKLKRAMSDASFVKEVEGLLSFDQYSPNPRSNWDFMPIRCLLSCISKMIEEIKILEKEIEKLCKGDKVVEKLMEIDGIGPITALSYIVNIDDPRRFKKSRSVGAYIGLTSSQYSSGESIKQGRISKCGPSDVRTLLYEAAVCLLRSKKWSKLKAFGLKIWRKKGYNKAVVAVARRLAVIMHSMWIKDSTFIRGEPSKKQLSEMEKLEYLLKEKDKKVKKQSVEQSKAA